MVKSYTRIEPGPVLGLVASASNPVLLPGGSAGWAAVAACESIAIWDIKTNTLVVSLVDSSMSKKSAVVRLAYEPNTSLLAAGYSDGAVRIWDLQSRSVLMTLSGHRSAISALTFDDSGTLLFSGSLDTNIVVWDLVAESGKVRFRGHHALITGLCLLNESWLLSTSKDGVLKLWDLDSQFCVESKVVSQGECWSLCLLPRLDTSYLEESAQPAADLESVFHFVSVSGNQISFWQLDLAKPENNRISNLGHFDKHTKQKCVGVCVSNEILVCGSGDALEMWSMRSPDSLKRLFKRRLKKAQEKDLDGAKLSGSDYFSPHALVRPSAKVAGLVLGAKSALVSLANNAIETFSLEKEPEKVFSVETPGHRSDVRDVCVSSDSKLILSGSNGLIKLYNVGSQKCLRTLENTGYILSMRFLPGDKLVVAGTKEGTINLYDIATSTHLESYKAHEGAVWSLDLSLDGTMLVSGGADKQVKFWRLKVVNHEVLGQPDVQVAKMELHNTHKIEFQDDVLAVKLSPDGRYVAAALLDNTIKVYYVDTLKFFLNLYGHQLPALSLDISHDSKLLISSSADKNIKIWGLDFGDCHKSIFAHEDSVLRVVFEPGSHIFFSCSKDGVVKSWDADKFVEIQKLIGHHSEVWALAVAPDASFLVSASHDKSIRVWEQTDEPLFIQEERENEMEQTYEQDLVDSLKRDLDNAGGPLDQDDQEEMGQAVTTHTLESLKAGERFYEALEFCLIDLETKPKQRHVILAALNVSPQEYLFDVLSKIKSTLVEDALLTFPLAKVNGLLAFVEIWLEERRSVALISRVLFFCLRNFHKQIVASATLRPRLDNIRVLLRDELGHSSDLLGLNIAHLTHLRQLWQLNHTHSFDAPDEESKKRTLFEVKV